MRSAALELRQAARRRPADPDNDDLGIYIREVLFRQFISSSSVDVNPNNSLERFSQGSMQQLGGCIVSLERYLVTRSDALVLKKTGLITCRWDVRIRHVVHSFLITPDSRGQ